jgi:hypothetical protein
MDELYTVVMSVQERTESKGLYVWINGGCKAEPELLSERYELPPTQEYDTPKAWLKAALLTLAREL